MATKSKTAPAKTPAYLETDDETINLLVEANPKRAGTAAHKRFALYRNGMTKAEFLEKGGLRADLYHDEDHGYVSFSSVKQRKAA